VVTNLLCPPSKSAARSIACVPVNTETPPGLQNAAVDAISKSSIDDAAVASSDVAASSTARDDSDTQGGATDTTAAAVGDGGGGTAAAAPVAVGDVWHGQYVCQGEQHLLMRIIKKIPIAAKANSLAPTDRVAYAGILGFRHTLASGVYRVRVVVDPADHRIIVVPGPWVHQPSDFMPLGFKGSIDPDGTLIFGVLPEVRGVIFCCTSRSTSATVSANFPMPPFFPFFLFPQFSFSTFCIHFLPVFARSLHRQYMRVPAPLHTRAHALIWHMPPPPPPCAHSVTTGRGR
jgi:hypothetical protein